MSTVYICEDQAEFNYAMEYHVADDTIYVNFDLVYIPKNYNHFIGALLTGENSPSGRPEMQLEWDSEGIASTLRIETGWFSYFQMENNTEGFLWYAHTLYIWDGATIDEIYFDVDTAPGAYCDSATTHVVVKGSAMIKNSGPFGYYYQPQGGGTLWPSLLLWTDDSPVFIDVFFLDTLEEWEPCDPPVRIDEANDPTPQWYGYGQGDGATWDNYYKPLYPIVELGNLDCDQAGAYVTLSVDVDGWDANYHEDLDLEVYALVEENTSGDCNPSTPHEMSYVSGDTWAVTFSPEQDFYWRASATFCPGGITERAHVSSCVLCDIATGGKGDPGGRLPGQ